MPCSQWDARRPGSEDVRVIGPLLRFRLLRPRGTRFGGLTEPVLSLQWKRPSWCRRGATDYRLACRSPLFASHPAPSTLPLELLAVQRLAITLYLVHVLPAAHNKAILMFDAPRSVAVVAVDGDTSFSEASRKLPADYLSSPELTSRYCETTVEESDRNVRATVRRWSCMIDAIALKCGQNGSTGIQCSIFLLSTFPFRLY